MEYQECITVSKVKYNVVVLDSWAAIKVVKEGNVNSTDKETESAHKVESNEYTAIPEIKLYNSDMTHVPSLPTFHHPLPYIFSTNPYGR